MTALIFDCDGTLVETEMLHAAVELEMLREHLGYEATLHEHNQRFSGAGLETVLREIAKEAGRDLPPELERLITEKKEKAFGSRVVAVPYVIEALDALADYPKCVASNAEASVLPIALKAAGLFERFTPYIFSASHVRRPKPFPDLFLYAAKQMGAEAKDCIVIEDSPHGVAAGKAAGMRVLGFAGASHCGPYHAQRLQDADQVFTDMRELPKLVAALAAKTGKKAG